jgi:hypothetical protein
VTGSDRALAKLARLVKADTLMTVELWSLARVLTRGQLLDPAQPFAISAAALPRRVQITQKPAAKGLGVHGIFMRGKSRKYVIADSALKRIQVDAWAFWLDADEHHPGFAPRTGGALKCNRWDGGRRTLRFGHDASPPVGGSTAFSIIGNAKDAGPMMVQVCAAGISNAS